MDRTNILSGHSNCPHPNRSVILDANVRAAAAIARVHNSVSAGVRGRCIEGFEDLVHCVYAEGGGLEEQGERHMSRVIFYQSTVMWYSVRLSSRGKRMAWQVSRVCCTMEALVWLAMLE